MERVLKAERIIVFRNEIGEERELRTRAQQIRRLRLPQRSISGSRARPFASLDLPLRMGAPFRLVCRSAIEVGEIFFHDLRVRTLRMQSRQSRSSVAAIVPRSPKACPTNRDEEKEGFLRPVCTRKGAQPGLHRLCLLAERREAPGRRPQPPPAAVCVAHFAQMAPTWSARNTGKMRRRLSPA